MTNKMTHSAFVITFKFLFLLKFFIKEATTITTTTTVAGVSTTVDICSANEVHALILARGGSKGVRLKNLIKIDELSILARTILAIQDADVFSSIWVSTDNERIATEALKFGALVHIRPERYAQDGTTSLESVREFLNAHNTIENFALFQCTSPFLNVVYILKAFAAFQRADCVFSITRSYKLRWQMIKDTILPLNFDPSQRPRRQSWHGELEENGMFYFSRRRLIDQNVFQNERCEVVEIAPEHAVDLDTFKDVLTARCLNIVNKFYY